MEFIIVSILLNKKSEIIHDECLLWLIWIFCLILLLLLILLLSLLLLLKSLFVWLFSIKYSLIFSSFSLFIDLSFWYSSLYVSSVNNFGFYFVILLINYLLNIFKFRKTKKNNNTSIHTTKKNKSINHSNWLYHFFK